MGEERERFVILISIALPHLRAGLLLLSVDVATSNILFSRLSTTSASPGNCPWSYCWNCDIRSVTFARLESFDSNS